MDVVCMLPSKFVEFSLRFSTWQIFAYIPCPLGKKYVLWVLQLQVCGHPVLFLSPQILVDPLPAALDWSPSEKGMLKSLNLPHADGFTSFSLYINIHFVYFWGCFITCIVKLLIFLIPSWRTFICSNSFIPNNAFVLLKSILSDINRAIVAFSVSIPMVCLSLSTSACLCFLHLLEGVYIWIFKKSVFCLLTGEFHLLLFVMFGPIPTVLIYCFYFSFFSLVFSYYSNILYLSLPSNKNLAILLIPWCPFQLSSYPYMLTLFTP